MVFDSMLESSVHSRRQQQEMERIRQEMGATRSEIRDLSSGIAGNTSMLARIEAAMSHQPPSSQSSQQSQQSGSQHNAYLMTPQQQPGPPPQQSHQYQRQIPIHQRRDFSSLSAAPRSRERSVRATPNRHSDGPPGGGVGEMPPSGNRLPPWRTERPIDLLSSAGDGVSSVAETDTMPYDDDEEAERLLLTRAEAEAARQ